jgi:hypothetical protein
MIMYDDTRAEIRKTLRWSTLGFVLFLSSTIVSVIDYMHKRVNPYCDAPGVIYHAQLEQAHTYVKGEHRRGVPLDRLVFDSHYDSILINTQKALPEDHQTLGDLEQQLATMVEHHEATHPDMVAYTTMEEARDRHTPLFMMFNALALGLVGLGAGYKVWQLTREHPVLRYDSAAAFYREQGLERLREKRD